MLQFRCFAKSDVFNINKYEPVGGFYISFPILIKETSEGNEISFKKNTTMQLDNAQTFPLMHRLCSWCLPKFFRFGLWNFTESSKTIWITAYLKVGQGLFRPTVGRTKLNHKATHHAKILNSSSNFNRTAIMAVKQNLVRAVEADVQFFQNTTCVKYDLNLYMSAIVILFWQKSEPIY